MADNIQITAGSGTTIATDDIGGFHYQKIVMANSSGTVVDPVAQVAHDAVDSGEPVKIGAKAVTSVQAQTLVAADDRTNIFADRSGVLINRPHAPLNDLKSEVRTITTATQTAFATASASGGMAAPAAGTSIFVTDVTVCNSSATNTEVGIYAGAAGALLWKFPAPADGGATHHFASPIKVGDNVALAYKVDDAVTTMTISASGFVSKAF